jgi:precorrin-2 methylase
MHTRLVSECKQLQLIPGVRSVSYTSATLGLPDDGTADSLSESEEE